jgi:hypothetical protein
VKLRDQLRIITFSKRPILENRAPATGSIPVHQTHGIDLDLDAFVDDTLFQIWDREHDGNVANISKLDCLQDLMKTDYLLNTSLHAVFPGEDWKESFDVEVYVKAQHALKLLETYYPKAGTRDENYFCILNTWLHKFRTYEDEYRNLIQNS